MGEPQLPQKYLSVPSGALKQFNDSSPETIMNSFAAAITFEANADPLAFLHREQWQ
jgi:hypothetical protein